MKKFLLKVLAVLLVVVTMGLPIFFYATSTGRAIWNDWFFKIQKVNDSTNYRTIKNVEDTCRAMIASYNTDKLTYEQYKDSTNKEKQGWAEQAKMRANKTASAYNNYILENSFVWKDNVPEDIYRDLSYLN